MAFSLAVNIAESWLMAVLPLVVSVPVAACYRSEGVASVLQVMPVHFLLVPFGMVTMARAPRHDGPLGPVQLPLPG